MSITDRQLHRCGLPFFFSGEEVRYGFGDLSFAGNLFVAILALIAAEFGANASYSSIGLFHFRRNLTIESQNLKIDGDNLLSAFPEIAL